MNQCSLGTLFLSRSHSFCLKSQGIVWRPSLEDLMPAAEVLPPFLSASVVSRTSFLPEGLFPSIPSHFRYIDQKDSLSFMKLHVVLGQESLPL